MSIKDDIEALEKAIANLSAWEAAGCPVTDPYDTYPYEMWEATARPDRIRRLLDAFRKEHSDAIRFRFFIENRDLTTARLSKACELLNEAADLAGQSLMQDKIVAFLREAQP